MNSPERERLGKTRGSASAFSRLNQLLLDGFQIGLRVEQGGLKVLVSHEFTDRGQRNAVAQFLGRVGVTQAVKGNRFRFRREQSRLLLSGNLKIALKVVVERRIVDRFPSAAAFARVASEERSGGTERLEHFP